MTLHAQKLIGTVAAALVIALFRSPGQAAPVAFRDYQSVRFGIALSTEKAPHVCRSSEEADEAFLMIYLSGFHDCKTTANSTERFIEVVLSDNITSSGLGEYALSLCAEPKKKMTCKIQFRDLSIGGFPTVHVRETGTGEIKYLVLTLAWLRPGDDFRTPQIRYSFRLRTTPAHIAADKRRFEALLRSVVLNDPGLEPVPGSGTRKRSR